METMKLRKAKFWQIFPHFQIPNEKLLTVCATNLINSQTANFDKKF